MSTLVLLFLMASVPLAQVSPKPASVKAQLAESVPLIGADRVHRDLGITGRGVRVMLIDDFGRGGTAGAHGRAVERIVRAVAPDAIVVACDAGFEGHMLSDARIKSCLSQIASQPDERRPDVVNLSFGRVDVETDEDIVFRHACRPADPHPSAIGGSILADVSRWTTFVAVTGNGGYRDAITSPGCLPQTISVGAVYDGQLDNVESKFLCGSVEPAAVDKVTCYSNTSAFTDLLAPGSRITGPGALEAAQCGQALSRARCLARFSGTSWAAPHVTGVVALIREAHPGLTPQEIRDILVTTGRPLAIRMTSASGAIAQYTIPRVEAYRAVREARRRVGNIEDPTSALTQLDVNDNCRIDQPEILNAIDSWIDNALETDAFLDAIDAWIEEFDVCTSSTSVNADKFEFGSVGTDIETSGDAIVFTAQGNAIQSLDLKVYDLAGRLVFHDENTGTQLRWPTQTDRGQPASNGVYLYRVTARGPDGQITHGDIGKFAILR